MAHEMETMFSVRETPWHGLGKIVLNAPSAEEAIKLAGLDWTVSTQQLYRNVAGQLMMVEANAVVRDSDNSTLGVVGKAYHPLQNSEAFKWFNPYIESGECSFETAGSLYNGKKIWILAKLNRAPIEVVKGDIVNKYLLLSNGHDGTMAVRTGFTPIRVVCNNTLSLSHRSSESQLIRLKHGRNVADNLTKIREVINTANAQFEATAEQYKKLAQKQIHKGDLEKYVNIVFFNSRDKQSDRKQLSEEKLTERIKELFEVGRGQDLKKVKGTYWALYNAATEYLSYDVGKNQDRRLDRLWFGKLKRQNEQALEVAFKMAVGK